MVDRGVGVFLVRLHQIDAGQVFVRGVNAVCVLARNADKGRQTGTGANENCFKTVAEQLIDGFRAADNEVEHELNTEVLQRVDFLLHDSLRQTELRNAVHEYAACGVQCLENGNFVTHTSQIACTGQTGRACTNDGNLVTVGFRLDCLFGAVLAGIVCNEALQTADGNGLTLDAAYAVALALALLRAYTAADSGQCGGLLDLGSRFEELALSDQRDELRNLNLYRAAGHAGLVFAVQAALCFLDRHFSGIAERYLFKVLIADVRCLLGHRALLRIHIRHLT